MSGYFEETPKRVLRSPPTGDLSSPVTEWVPRRTSEPQASGGAEIDFESHQSLNAEPKQLREHVRTILKKNPIGLSPDGYYLPDEDFDTLFTFESVAQALGGSVVTADIIDFAASTAKRAFATLLFVFATCEDRLMAVRSMKESHFTDEELDSGHLVMCPARPCKEAGCKHIFPYDQPWDNDPFDDFKRKRWQFLVPTFKIREFTYEFDMQRLLPFLGKVSQGEVLSGHFSDVSKVEMLSSKQDLVNTANHKLKIALKTLRDISDPGYNIEEEWQRESKAHKQLNDKSEHLVQAFAAFVQRAMKSSNDKYHLVLEWADGGSLYSYWQKNSKPQIDHRHPEESRARVLEALKQLVGLAGAIEGMHSTEPTSPASSLYGSMPSSPDTPVSSDFGPSINIEESSSPIPVSMNLSPPRDVSRLGGAGMASLTRRTTGFNSKNWRHGDIKPENILRFTENNPRASLGKLKLADLGRAQQHDVATRLRQTKEKELWRTRWYEPPDLEEIRHKEAKERISRLFDIWSFGCVIFETVLWLLYGTQSHEDFVQACKLQQGQSPYWTKVEKTSVYVVSPTLENWIKHILKHDPEATGAIGKLLELVRDRLLRIDLPPNTEEYMPGCRTNAWDLKHCLQDILDQAHSPSSAEFLFTGRDRSTVVKPPSHVEPTTTHKVPSPSALQVPGHNGSVPMSLGRGRPTEIAERKIYTNNMSNEWKAQRDTEFVEPALQGRSFNEGEADLCDECKQVDFHGAFVNFRVATLINNEEEDSENECNLCALLYSSLKKLKVVDKGGVREMDYLSTQDAASVVRLERIGGRIVLRIDGSSIDVLRLCFIEGAKRGSETISVAAPSIKYPGPKIRVDTNVKDLAALPNAWLKECNDKHANPSDASSTCVARQCIEWPKRLVSLEDVNQPKIIDTATAKLMPASTRYIAFSHKWGKMPKDAVTTGNNLAARMDGIPLNQMPLSFKHAFAMTRALDCNYIWIDSLCIMQADGEDKGDFDEQADKMETTFSNAYCVLAACSAEGATKGFLKWPKSKYVRLGDLYVSSTTDNFDRDVLNSPLSKRGWVLQERALARRTIFFTDTQMYWECGNSIRCATGGRLINDKVAFLGDANFPDYTIRANRTHGEQLALFIDLVQRYSRLGFSHPEDRPVAIDGLMERLTTAFRTSSLAGLLHRWWGRCLLWRRADDTRELIKIPKGSHTRKTPPTWSWMAYEGAISYIEPEGESVIWNEDDIKLPIHAHSKRASWLRTSAQAEDTDIQAKKAYALRTEADIRFDGRQRPVDGSDKCVIIARGKANSQDQDKRLHYIMVIRKRTKDDKYERVGVGAVPGKDVAFEDALLDLPLRIA